MKWFCILFFHFVILTTLGQSIEANVVQTLEFKEENFKTFVGVDTQENFYFTRDQEVIKVSGGQEWSYTSFELGFPSNISLLNSLEILVFYEQANTFVLLDRSLSETNRVQLNNLTTPQSAQLLTNAKNDEIWLVDNFDNKLKFINYLNDLRSSVSINLPEPILDLKANFNEAYLLSENNLYQYDTYGTLLHEIAVVPDSKLILGNRYLVLNNKEGYILYNVNLLKEGTFDIKQNNTVDSYMKDEKFYIFENGIITTYQLEIKKK